MARQATPAASELVSRAKAIAAAPADHRPMPGFEARLAGPLVGGDVAAGGRVTAVLERTAVVQLEARRKGLARIPDVLVDPAVIEWVPQRTRSWADRSPSKGDRAEMADPDVVEDGAFESDTLVQALDHLDESDVDSELRPAPAMPAESPPLAPPAAPVSQPSPPAGEEPATAPGDIEAAPPVDVDREVGTGAEAEEARSCEHCGRPLPRRNRQGVCTLCQSTCPDCDGPKAIKAERCRACSREAPPGLAEGALAVAGDLEGLPAQVQELLDQVVTLARYAQALEDELDRRRTAERRMRRRARAALETRS